MERKWMYVKRISRNHIQITQFFPVKFPFYVYIMFLYTMHHIDVRYTNYVRLNGFLHTDQNNAEKDAEPTLTNANSSEQLHPSNDPEREGEIRYRRLPAQGRNNGPERTHVTI